jgi:hypothetical protein
VGIELKWLFDGGDGAPRAFAAPTREDTGRPSCTGVRGCSKAAAGFCQVEDEELEYVVSTAVELLLLLLLLLLSAEDCSLAAAALISLRREPALSMFCIISARWCWPKAASPVLVPNASKAEKAMSASIRTLAASAASSARVLEDISTKAGEEIGTGAEAPISADTGTEGSGAGEEKGAEERCNSVVEENA